MRRSTASSSAACWTASHSCSMALRGTGYGRVESARELIERFIKSPDTSKRTFIEKLRDQLADASSTAVQLLTELTWLHVVVSTSY